MIQAPERPQAETASGAGGSALPLLLAWVILFRPLRHLHGLAKLLAAALFMDFARSSTYTTVEGRGLNTFDPHAVAQLEGLVGIRRAGRRRVEERYTLRRHAERVEAVYAEVLEQHISGER